MHTVAVSNIAHHTGRGLVLLATAWNAAAAGNPCCTSCSRPQQLETANRLCAAPRAAQDSGSAACPPRSPAPPQRSLRPQGPWWPLSAQPPWGAWRGQREHMPPYGPAGINQSTASLPGGQNCAVITQQQHQPGNREQIAVHACPWLQRVLIWYCISAQTGQQPQHSSQFYLQRGSPEHRGTAQSSRHCDHAFRKGSERCLLEKVGNWLGAVDVGRGLQGSSCHRQPMRF